jgi:hypothetical protein
VSSKERVGTLVRFTGRAGKALSLRGFFSLKREAESLSEEKECPLRRVSSQERKGVLSGECPPRRNRVSSQERKSVLSGECPPRRNRVFLSGEKESVLSGECPPRRNRVSSQERKGVLSGETECPLRRDRVSSQERQSVLSGETSSEWSVQRGVEVLVVHECLA